MPRGLHAQHSIAGARLGANQGHAGGLPVALIILLERLKQKIYTHAKHSRQAFENDTDRIRLFPSFQFTDNRVPYPCPAYPAMRGWEV